VKLKRRINITKQTKKIKRIKFKLKKITYHHKLGLKDKIENKSKFYKRT
jgi:Cu/Ag efflux protein CusF